MRKLRHPKGSRRVGVEPSMPGDCFAPSQVNQERPPLKQFSFVSSTSSENVRLHFDESFHN